MRRSVPKKKLPEAEMVEMNRCYCILGRCEQHLAQLQNPETASTSKRGWSARMRIADAYGCQTARQKLLARAAGTGFVRLSVLSARRLVETGVQAPRFVEF
jgi:hypothetical protein